MDDGLDVAVHQVVLEHVFHADVPTGSVGRASELDPDTVALAVHFAAREIVVRLQLLIGIGRCKPDRFVAVGRDVAELRDLFHDLLVGLAGAKVDDFEIVDLHVDRRRKEAVPRRAEITERADLFELAFVDQFLHVRDLVAREGRGDAGIRRVRRAGRVGGGRVARAADVQDGEKEQGNDRGLHGNP